MKWRKAAAPDDQLDVCIDLRERLAPYVDDADVDLLEPWREELIDLTDSGPYRPRHLAR